MFPPHLDQNYRKIVPRRARGCEITRRRGQETRLTCNRLEDVGRVSERERIECVRLRERRDGEKEKCDNRSEQEGRLEVVEMFGGVNGASKETRHRDEEKVLETVRM